MRRRRRKACALKASKYESDWESEPDDEELAMLARRFRKFFKKTGERRKFKNFKNQREKKEVIICYEYKKPGHIIISKKLNLRSSNTLIISAKTCPFAALS